MAEAKVLSESAVRFVAPRPGLAIVSPRIQIAEPSNPAVTENPEQEPTTLLRATALSTLRGDPKARIEFPEILIDSARHNQNLAFRISPLQMRILEATIRGETDEEIGSDFGINSHSVKVLRSRARNPFDTFVLQEEADLIRTSSLTNKTIPYSTIRKAVDKNRIGSLRIMSLRYTAPEIYTEFEMRLLGQTSQV